MHACMACEVIAGSTGEVHSKLSSLKMEQITHAWHACMACKTIARSVGGVDFILSLQNNGTNHTLLACMHACMQVQTYHSTIVSYAVPCDWQRHTVIIIHYPCTRQCANVHPCRLWMLQLHIPQYIISRLHTLISRGANDCAGGHD